MDSYSDKSALRYLHTHTFILGEKSSSFHTVLCYIHRFVNCSSSCG